MKVFPTYLLDIPWFSLISIIAGLSSVVAVPTTIYIFLKQRKEKLPCYVKRGMPSNFYWRFLPEGVPVDMAKFGFSVGLTKFVFWNEGRAVINRVDIPIAGRWKIQCSNNARILDARITFQKISNDWSLDDAGDGSSCYLEFEYLGFREVMILEILHTGDSADFHVIGSVKGARDISQIPLRGEGFLRFYFGSTMVNILTGLSFVVGGIGTIYLIILYYRTGSSFAEKSAPLLIWVAFILIAALFTAVGSVIYGLIGYILSRVFYHRHLGKISLLINEGWIGTLPPRNS